MTLGDLMTLARTLLRDKQEPYFWSDVELTEFANEAVDEACMRARLLESRVIIPVSAGIDRYTIPYNVLRLVQVDFIDQATTETTAGSFVAGQWYTVVTPGDTDFTLVGAANSLAGTTFQATGSGSGTGTAYLGLPTRLGFLSQPQYSSATAWGGAAASCPSGFTTGDNANEILVYPIPSVAGALAATVRRLPSATERMDDLSDIPVIPEVFHHDLVYWVLSAAYNVNVVDTKDTVTAEKYEAKFEARFGRRPTARGETAGVRYGVGTNIYPVDFLG